MRARAPWRPRMWMAHALTIARIPLAIAFWFVASRPAWALAVLGAAALSDIADGRVARRARRTWAKRSRFDDAGAWLDPLCDKFFAVTVLAALAIQQTPVSMLLLVGARELLVVPLVAVYLATPLHTRFAYDFRAIPAGKRATVAQFVAIVAVVAQLPAPVQWAAALGTALLGIDAAVFYAARGWRALRAPVNCGSRCR